MLCPYHPILLWWSRIILLSREVVKAKGLNPPNPPLLKGAEDWPAKRANRNYLYQRRLESPPLVKGDFLSSRKCRVIIPPGEGKLYTKSVL
jgi:hypothetical protein